MPSSGNRRRSARSERDREVQTARAIEAPEPPASNPPPFVDRGPALIPLDMLVGGYLTMIVLAFVILRLPGVMPRGNEMNVDRAAFLVVNAATLSGFRMDVTTGQFGSGHPVGSIVILLLTWGGTFFTLVTGGIAGVRILRLKFTDRDVIGGALTAMAVTTLCGAALLIGHGRSLGDALLLASSAFGNSGVITGPAPELGEMRTWIVLLPLATLGGLGLPVLMELYQFAVTWSERIFAARRGESAAVQAHSSDDSPRLSDHTRTVLALSAAIYIGGFLLLLITRQRFWSSIGAALSEHMFSPELSGIIRRSLLSSSAASINSRSAGFPLESTDALPRTTLCILIVLMMIGAHSAGTAGGIKATTLVQLYRGIRDVLAGRPVPRAFGIAAVWVAGYVAIVCLGFVLLLWQVPQMASDALLLLSVSAASNVGLSPNSLSLVLGPLYTLSLVMMLGRLAPLAVLWWMARKNDEPGLLVG